MKPEVAWEILSVAKEGGYLDEEIPEDEEEVVATAGLYLTHALAAAEAGKADETCEAIIALGEPGEMDGYVQEPDPEEEPEPDPEPEPEPEEPEAPAEEPEGKKEKPKPRPKAKPKTDEAVAIPRTTHDNLPLPQQLEGEVPVMPRDISSIADKQVRRLASEFQACLNVAIWQLKNTMDKVLRSKQLRSAAYREAYLAEDAAAREAGMKTTKEALDMAAQSSPAVSEFDDQIFELERLAGDYKALKEIYEGNVSRLSREATLRDDEFKRSGGR